MHISKLRAGIVTLGMLLASVGVVGTGSTAFAAKQVSCPQGTGLSQQGNNCKVTICHATSAVNNPYTRPTVDIEAADGQAGNSGGQPDHYGEHQGPVFNVTMKQGDNWGDIIPPIPGKHSGLNWTAEGQAVWNNNCNPVTPGRGGGGQTQTLRTTQEDTVQGPAAQPVAPAQVPQGGVSAGVGGLTSLSIPALAGVIASVMAVLSGLYMSRKI